MAEENQNAQAQAGNNGAQQTQQTAATATPEIDYDKLAAAVDKGTQQKENAVLKGYFSSQGMSEDEIKAAIADFKTKKSAAAKAKDDTLTKLQTENESLKKQILNSKIESKATAAADKLGADKKAIPYILKMADMSKATNDKGEISEEEIEAAITKVLTDVPSLKATAAQTKGFVNVGAQNNTEPQSDTDELHKLMGLK